MGVSSWVAWQLFVLSSIGNALLFFRLKSNKKKPEKSLELQEFLSDLMRGGGIVRVIRINPEDILLRSPRENRS